MSDKKIEITPNCYACEHFRNRIRWERRPLHFSDAAYCAMAGNSDTAPVIEDKQSPKECCSYDIRVISALDEEIRNAKQEQKAEMFKKNIYQTNKIIFGIKRHIRIKNLYMPFIMQ